MTRLTIELTSEKALRLLQDLEDLNIIRIVKAPVKLSSLRKKIKTRMSAETVDKGVNELRNEWQRDI